MKEGRRFSPVLVKFPCSEVHRAESGTSGLRPLTSPSLSLSGPLPRKSATRNFAFLTRSAHWTWTEPRGTNSPAISHGAPVPTVPGTWWLSLQIVPT